MELESKIQGFLTKNASAKNIDGYVNSYKDNIFENIEEKYFLNDLLEGAGKELNSKFKALWSSSALVVNNFVPFIKNLEKIRIENNIFQKGNFERKLSTGLGGKPPHIDFSLENNELILGFESKFLETLRKTEAKFSNSYFTLNYLNNEFFELIEKYNGKIQYLDTAQLLKHSIGLINYCKNFNKKAILYYIYWTPKNWNIFIEYKTHEKELEIFSKELNSLNILEFKSIKYIDFWDIYIENDLMKEHIINMKKRYEFIV